MAMCAISGRRFATFRFKEDATHPGKFDPYFANAGASKKVVYKSFRDTSVDKRALIEMAFVFQ